MHPVTDFSPTMFSPVINPIDADCAFNYGDIMVWAFDLRIFATGTAAVAIAASALAAFFVFLITTFVKSRSVRIIGSLGDPTAAGDAQSAESDSPACSRHGSFDSSKPEPSNGTISENAAEGT